MDVSGDRRQKGASALSWRSGGISLFICCALSVAAAWLTGCDREKPAEPSSGKAASAQPSLRIYGLAGAAGAIEPCGCVKDMLGGIDHAAAFMTSQKKSVPHSLVVGAGPMFFSDPRVEATHEKQALFKAEAMAESLRDLGLTAWAPGANDWAMGVERMSALTKETGARALAANLGQNAGPVSATHVVKIGDLKVGLVGISVPQVLGVELGFPVGDASAALKKAISAVKGKGAQIVVLLVAAPRGDALRLIEGASSELQLAVLGKPYDQGEANDAPFAPEIIGGTLVTQAPNHLQGISVVDLFVRDGDLSFEDGSGLASIERRASLEGRIRDLETRISDWKKPGSGVSHDDLKKREAQLADLKQQHASIAESKVPGEGSYFLYELTEVRESHGEEGRVASRLMAYYRKVNEFNKKAFADKRPPPVEPGQSSYVGVEVCSSCHLEERAFWNKMRHAKAYDTLVSQHKEFNLECVSCHVTGYEKPGGSTVAHVENLTAVQCEVCHGPGSRHVADPSDMKLIDLEPPRTMCASSCHHPPHVGPTWNVDEAWPKIIGEGHRVDNGL